MKQLTLMRHGEAMIQALDQNDFHRALSPRAARDIYLVRKQLTESAGVPELIYCSPAVRTKQSLEIFLEDSPLGIVTVFQSSLYAAEAEALQLLIARSAEEREHVMIIGHNPSLEELLFSLCSRHIRLRPANAFSLSLDIQTWPEIFGPVTVGSLSLFRP
ncbi:MAG TPA: hypothetical protein ENN41_09815 [Sediminispirochaeta sp.]|nr:hypothetical protein [Sediminispirochaeta sp.]